MSNLDNKSLFLPAVCEDCDYKFKVSSCNEAAESKIVQREFYNKSDDKSIFLTYYDCPKCNRRHYVQIDDFKSLNKLKDVKRQFIKLAVLKKKNKEIPKTQLLKFEKSRKDLSSYRRKLMCLYDGKKIYDNELDVEFVLKLSV